MVNLREKKFCKNCGVPLDLLSIPLMAKSFVQLADGFYCRECGTEIVKERRKKIKK